MAALRAYLAEKRTQLERVGQDTDTRPASEALCSAELENFIRQTVMPEERFALLCVAVVALIPFASLALGYFARCKRQDRMVPPWEGTLAMLILAYVIALGWLYLFHPLGLGASMVRSFHRTVNPLGSGTYPVFFDLAQSNFRHLLLSFLGWYVWVCQYTMQRGLNQDVLASGIYRMLFTKFLVVLAASLALGEMSFQGSAAIAFLIGIFPMSAVSALQELTQKKIDVSNADVNTLSILPDITRDAILRLEEAGVVTLPDLANVRLNELRGQIPEIVIPARAIRDWIDMARLICAVGPQKWQEIRWTCMTASHFAERAGDREDSAFVEAMALAQIHNSQEIVQRLARLYPRLPPVGPLGQTSSERP